MSTCRRGSRDIRQKLFQILCELVLIEDFLVVVVGFDEKTYFRLILFKKVGNLLVLRHRLQVPRRVSMEIFSGIKGERLTRRIVSRIPFAVWNTVAASPIATVAVPNTSDIVDEREKVVARALGHLNIFQPPDGQHRPTGLLGLPFRKQSQQPAPRKTQVQTRDGRDGATSHECRCRFV